jgi:iron-sulfur cluster assembly protein
MFSIPNKPPISLTPRAVSHIKALINNSEALALRVGVKKGGCAGMEYTIEYVKEV